ncbi:MAG TPA: ABC transporter ATP-binding protein, partial [Segeticoccus sp.]|uniref:ABC transporter ATP-binding protein n=1 Tax=Segeticoccus sp. TaxID=2706531 RepID=UPI002D80ECB9
MGDPDQGWIRRLVGCLLVHRRDALLSLGAALLGGVLNTAVPLIARQIVDAVIIAHTQPLAPWVVLLVAVALAAFGFAYVRRYRGGRMALNVQNDLRTAMHERLQSMDLQTLSHLPTGQVVARANSDTTLVQGLLSFFPIMTGNVLMLVLSLGVMIYLSPLLSVVSIAVAPLLFVVSYRMRDKIFPASWDGQQREGDVAQIVDEDVAGVRVVKAFGQERHELGRIVDAAQRLYGSQMRAVRLTARYQPVMKAVPTLGQVAILGLGGWMALHENISIGTFLAFSTYVAQFVAPARQLAGVLTVGQQARAGVERIFQLLDTQPAIVDAPDAVELPALRGEVEWRAVRFGYGEDDPPALDGFSLRVRPGERVALVGPSGCGKSTAMALVGRFHDPRAGAVLVDGADVRGVALRSLRRQVGYAFEESFLFSQSVRANIAYGRPDATEEEVLAAARVAQAHGFIERLPGGYDTPIGERGHTLSGGQRQRIALARVVLADPRILVLDDATSAVDSRTEEAIHEGLRRVMADRTTLLVAHRASTLHLADRVVVVDAGQVVDEGRHEELMARNSFYRGLLAGLDPEESLPPDRIERWADAVDGVTESAWQRDTAQARAAANRSRPTAATLGAGLGRGHGGGWRMALAPTPELLAKVDALPPVRDRATVDLAAETRRDAHFGLRRLLREFRRPLLFGLVFVILDAVAGLAGPFLVKVGVDQGVVAGSSSALFAATFAYLGFTVFDTANQAAETFVTGRTAQRVMLSLRVRIWAQLQRLSLDYYEREMAGRVMTRMTTDVDSFESLIENGLLSALVAIATFLGVGVVLLVLDLPLALATMSVILPLAWATVLFRRRASALYDVARDRIAVVNADFQESLAGVREAQAFAHEPATTEHFHGLATAYVEARVAAQRLVATYFPFVQFLSAVADAIVLGVGAELIAHGHLTTGALIAFLLYIDMFFNPIQQLSQVFDSWQQTRVSVGRIAELLALETSTPEADDPLDPGLLRGELTAGEVHFRYPQLATRPGGAGGSSVPSPPTFPDALTGVSLDVPAGETVALVGETGAGKSTMMKLFARFYDPTDGQVTVDRHDLRTLDSAAYHRQLGYVPQETFLFTGTVRDNIAYGRPEATDAEVEEAARAVGAHDVIAGLRGGYLHEVSERGASLSLGQRQLIALARAELVAPAVLLLDEATASLDLATEARVVAAMHRVSRRRTTVLIAHRLPTARAAHRIVLLHQGRVTEVGTHDELLAA